MKQLKILFLFIYTSISLATFYHSAWGFATLQGEMPTENQGSLFGWWFVGILMAFAIDVGMGAIVFALISGYYKRWFIYALVILAFASGYTQLIFALHHATVYEIGQVASWLGVFSYALEARVIILPLLLPVSALIFGFAAKSSEIEVKKETKQPEILIESKPQLPLDPPDLTPTQTKMYTFIVDNGPLTRQEVKSLLNVNATYVTRYIKPLLERDLIEEGDNGLLKIKTPESQ